ncbi:MAG: hypothetical protein NTU80_11695 [Verrucomicrobia bacterium]|nr:hypothetical protein [Verrucomicrobiota bacterium]
MPTIVLKKNPRRSAVVAKTLGLKMNKLIRDPLTGLIITARRPGQKLITSEDVARAIAE